MALVGCSKSLCPPPSKAHPSSCKHLSSKVRLELTRDCISAVFVGKPPRNSGGLMAFRYGSILCREGRHASGRLGLRSKAESSSQRRRPRGRPKVSPAEYRQEALGAAGPQRRRTAGEWPHSRHQQRCEHPKRQRWTPHELQLKLALQQERNLRAAKETPILKNG